MSYMKRLDHAFKNAPILPINQSTKYVFFSDCHRGVGSNNDNFVKNKNNFLAALQYYYENSYHYIEVGDGDELWENRNFSQIVEAYSDIFCQLGLFHKSGRLHMLYGNHDMEKKKLAPLFENMQFHEGLILQQTQPHLHQRNSLRNLPNSFHSPTDKPLHLHVTHGHQADFLNSVLWKLTRFLVRYLWTPLEAFGFTNPTSASENNVRKDNLEQKYLAYAKENDCLLLVGHTHRPALGSVEMPYFNCGSCVNPDYITCIELDGFYISLVKWYTGIEKSGCSGKNRKHPPIYPVFIKREVIASEIL